jgi:hypothetical protein
VAFFSPVIDGGMAEIVKSEVLDIRFLQPFHSPSDVIHIHRFPVPMKNTVAIQGPHLQNFPQDLHQFNMDRD